ncbi:DUF1090 domain-containing protein [Glaciimonas soli]|uniref:DUF1090 family protein n=1 Tax=Glaciimonas soli TaxID=2590999 RepID=A0A843YSZ0_9BURK|nr:DUF1090 domain-containing protein [Glaciimonas soli]MQR00703.1 DUF1090 family protein [Glaciimonas soli]
MRYLRSATLAATILISLPALAQSPVPAGCAAKRASLEKEMDYAKAHGNSGRIAGLQTALDAVRNNCSEASLAAEREEKITEKTHAVEEKKADLKRAQASGSPKKIAKSKSKLAHAEAELEEAKRAP